MGELKIFFKILSAYLFFLVFLSLEKHCLSRFSKDRISISHKKTIHGSGGILVAGKERTGSEIILIFILLVTSYFVSFSWTLNDPVKLVKNKDVYILLDHL